MRSSTLLRQHVRFLRTVMKELADRVTKDTTVTKRQIDLATRTMLDQISGLSDGDYEQSMAIQLFLDCIDRAIRPPTAFVSFREQPMHVNDNQTLSLRVVDPIADGGVWANMDDGCSCCHGEVWRTNAEAKMKVLHLQPIWVYRRGTTFNGVGTSTTSGKQKHSHGHTTASVRHGDTGVRAFTRNLEKRHILWYCPRRVRQSWA